MVNGVRGERLVVSRQMATVAGRGVLAAQPRCACAGCAAAVGRSGAMLAECRSVSAGLVTRLYQGRCWVGSEAGGWCGGGVRWKWLGARLRRTHTRNLIGRQQRRAFSSASAGEADGEEGEEEEEEEIVPQGKTHVALALDV